MATEAQIHAAARAIYEARPLKKDWWPGIGEVIRWEEMVYDMRPLSRLPYIELARAALKAAENVASPRTDGQSTGKESTK